MNGQTGVGVEEVFVCDWNECGKTFKDNKDLIKHKKLQFI